MCQMLGPCAFERILVDTWLQPSNNFSAQFGRSLFAWIPQYREEYLRNWVCWGSRGALEMEKGYVLDMEKRYALGGWKTVVK